ncbi:hypothetical protein OAH07_01565 [Verrucomicrobia bacterium]|nr:hypothetical protein [bacterium]MDB4744138.1 hypothetical protein [Verrucomicrobiota bacterium]MDB4795298.1 hypothetical protein [Verrucomicrobiota bacterium]MDC0317861.1 hypothetical protein [bacterium]
MNLPFYKPNAKNAGVLANFSIGQRDSKPVFYLNMIRQHSWDANKRTGSFRENNDDPDKKVAIKFNHTELGEFLASMSSRTPYSGFHNFNDNKTSIILTPWDKARKVRTKDGEQSYKTNAFGLVVTRNGSDTFRLPLDPGEVKILERFIYQYLDLYFASNVYDSKPKAPKPNTRQNQSSSSEASEDDVF